MRFVRSWLPVSCVLALACHEATPRASSTGAVAAPLTVTTTAEFGTASRSDSVNTLGNELTRARPSLGFLPWQSSTALPSARRGHTALVHNDTLYVVGGSTTVFGASTSVLYSRLNLDGTPVGFLSTTSFPTARHGIAAVAHNGYLYVTGGDAGGVQPLTGPVHYARLNADGTVAAWTATAGFPTSRIWHQAVVANNFLYIIGGSAGGALSSIVFAPIHTDGSLGAFATTTSLPSARQLLAAVAHGGRLYVTGGQAGTNESNEVWSAVIAPNGQLGPFVQHTSFSGARFGHTVVIAQGSMYVMGGQGSSFFNGVEVARVFADGTLGAFTSAPSFAGARFAHGGAVWNDALYVIGGEQSGGATASVQQAQLTFTEQGQPGAWASGTSLVTARSGAASVQHAGRVYVIGGRDGANALRNDVEVADFGNNFVTLASTFTTARENATAFVFNDRLYVGGGTGSSGNLSDLQVAPINSNGTLGTFTTLARTLTSARFGAEAVVHNDRVYVVGGFDTAFRSDVHTATFNADGTINPFTATAAFTGGRVGHAAIVIGHRLYVVGGNTGTAQTGVQYATILANGLLGPFVASPNAMTTARTSHAVVAWNDVLYVAGGSLTQADTEFAAVTEDGSLRPFVVGPALPVARNSVVSAMQNGVWWVVGGSSSGGTLATSVRSTLQGALGLSTTFTNGPNLASGRTVACAAVSNQHLYVIGGSDGALPLTSVAVARVTPTGLQGFTTQAGALPDERLAAACTAWQGQLYVVGGLGTNTERVLRAPVLPDAGVGAFSAISQPLSRVGHGVAVWDDRLYVVGGNAVGQPDPDNRVFMMSVGAAFDGGIAEVATLPGPVGSAAVAAHARTLYVMGGNGSTATWAAPIAADGSLGAFSPTTWLPRPVQAGVAVARDGFMYVVETLQSTDVFVAPILAPGQLGAWRLAASSSPARNQPAVAEGQGVLFVIAGSETNGNPLASTRQMRLNAPMMVGRWSRSLDFGAAQTVDSLRVNGSGTRAGLFQAAFRFGDATGPFGPMTVSSDLKPGEARAIGQRGVRTMWLELELDDRLASPLTRTIDARNATDVVVTTSFPPVVAVASPTTVPPRGATTLTCSGGSGTGYTWSLPTNGSGGSITPTGSYTAGATPSVADVARCTDSAGNSGDVTLTIGPGVSLTPSSASVTVGGDQQFSASGGSGTGFVWSIFSNLSGATISRSGLYTAGVTGGVSDVVRVVDSLGNPASATVVVSMGVVDAGSGGTDAGSGGTDAGSGGTDAGPGGTDAGSSSTDAGSSSTDAGSGSTDAGSSSTDAGSSSTDAGSSSTDAGSSSTDAGSSSTDAGSSSTDAGSSSTDAGSGSTDAGSGMIDAGALEMDAGLPVDGGVVDGGRTEPDAGAMPGPVDGGQTLLPDGGVGPDAPATGCGCTTGSDVAGLLALAALWSKRRRTRP
ncbi:MAG: hypothetical protein MUC96_15840 [Myxococcaceae bacterium]|jgi:MYXO-CTERM domain-containing protein|nr:hypothetical protein [Myxococcaceae bacterium]